MTGRSVIRLTLALVILIGATTFVHGSITTDAQQTTPQRDAVILLDVTRSMVGEGGPPLTPDIWADVQARVVELLSQMSADTTVTIIPFADGARLSQVWPQPVDTHDVPLTFQSLEGDQRFGAIRHIQTLVPDGQGTFICESLEYALDKLNQRRQTLGGDRIQTIYLYTDGEDTSSTCADDFATKLADIFNAKVGDYPFLHTVYIDISGTLSDEDKEKIRRFPVEITDGTPPSIQLQEETIALGNLATAENGVTVSVRVTSDLPGDGALRTANVSVIGKVPGLRVEPAVIELAPVMEFTLTPEAEFSEGMHDAVLQFIPHSGNFILVNGSIQLTYAWQVPTPTPTNTPTWTPTPTATFTPTATPTTIPTPTPTWTPSPTIEPTPTSTPVPAFLVSASGTDLGIITAGSDSPLTGEFNVQIEETSSGSGANATYDVVVSLDGVEDADQLWVVDESGSRVSRATFSGNTEAVTVGYSITAEDESRFLPGSGTRPGAVIVQSTMATMQNDESSPDSLPSSSTSVEIPLIYTIDYPLSLRHLVLLAALLALITVIGYVILHPRFPKDAKVLVTGGDLYPLRSIAERGLLDRMFRQSIPIGTYAGPKSIDIGAESAVAKLVPGRSRLSLRSRDAYLVPQLGGVDDALRIDSQYEPIEEAVRLIDGTTIRTGRGRKMTYQDRSDDRDVQGH